MTVQDQQDLKNVINEHDQEYARLLHQVLLQGTSRSDRTGTGTLSVFAPDPLRFDLRQSVPLLTTKRVPWKAVIKELLWFLRGDTDARVLQREGVRIWDGNTSRAFLDARGLDYQEGILGPGYGWQFRRSGAPYNERFADTRALNDAEKAELRQLGGFDQIAYVERLLKEDPYSRRIYINLWNPIDLDKMALTPCHLSVQFYVRDGPNGQRAHGQRELNAQVYIRSNDLFLGNPFNIFSYAVLVYLLAKRSQMTPGDLTICIGDAHIYKDHLEQIAEQLKRTSFKAPSLQLSERLCHVDFSDMIVDDFQVMDYQCHPAIKASMSI